MKNKLTLLLSITLLSSCSLNLSGGTTTVSSQTQASESSAVSSEQPSQPSSVASSQSQASESSAVSSEQPSQPSSGVSSEAGELSGEGVPSPSIGEDGDIYVDTLTGKRYIKAAGMWIAIEVEESSQSSEISSQTSLESSESTVPTSSSQAPVSSEYSSESSEQSSSEQSSSQSSSSQAVSSQPVSSSSSSSSSKLSSSSSSQIVSSSSSYSSKSNSSSSSSSSKSSSSWTVSSSSSSVSQSASGSDIDFGQWTVSKSLYGKEFMVALAKKINATRTKTTTYSNCLYEGAKAAAYPNASSSTFVPFYHGSGESKLATTSSCNREHTWPKSRGGNSFEADPIMVRPTFTSDNSSRGNKFYGNRLSNEWDPASCGYEAARGEAARIILYCATCYYSQGVSLSNNPGDSTGKKTMGTLKTLLQWNRQYRPTEFEKLVCDRYDKMGYARNAFVDCPELADYIWDENGLRTSALEGGAGGDTPIPVTSYNYEKVTSVSQLDGQAVTIISADPSNSANHYAMTGDAKSASLPWYLIGDAVDSVSGNTATNAYKLPSATFHKNDDDTFRITFGTQDLIAYTDGSHNSITLTAQSNAVSSSTSWNIDIGDSGTVISSLLPNGKTIYLEYYNGSFCGYQYQPKVLPSLYLAS